MTIQNLKTNWKWNLSLQIGICVFIYLCVQIHLFRVHNLFYQNIVTVPLVHSLSNGY